MYGCKEQSVPLRTIKMHANTGHMNLMILLFEYGIDNLGLSWTSKHCISKNCTGGVFAKIIGE